MMAILPVLGLSNGRLAVECKLDQAASSMPAWKARYIFRMARCAGEAGMADEEALVHNFPLKAQPRMADSKAANPTAVPVCRHFMSFSVWFSGCG
jgi:hypothetical protein